MLDRLTARDTGQAWIAASGRPCISGGSGEIDAYVKFMTTPGSHNDSFASSHHRHFWGNYAAGIAPEECAEASDKVHDATDAFTFPIPLLIAELGSDNEVARKDALSVNKLFRKSETLDKWVDLYLVMLT